MLAGEQQMVILHPEDAASRGLAGAGADDSLSGQAPNRTLLLPPREEHELVEIDSLTAGSAAAVPTAQQGLE